MTYTKTLLAAALLAGAGVAQAELSANLGVASNYYFRGITQTDDKAAVSGGIDYTHDSGLYLGTWMSNVDFGGKEDVEVDGYAGFGGDIGDTGLGYDLSAWTVPVPSRTKISGMNWPSIPVGRTKVSRRRHRSGTTPLMTTVRVSAANLSILITPPGQSASARMPVNLVH
jgi:hypothetical protein